jgi:hypothetical protein
MEQIKRVCVFDFDGTLVFTPTKPAGWKAGWWGKRDSLLPPFVPHHSGLQENGAHLLNNKVAKAFIESKLRSDTHTVMMTGRHWGLRNEVMNILRGFNLCTKEDHERLQEDSKHFVFISGGKTLEGKLAVIDELFAMYPSVDWIEMWEDRIEHVSAFRAHAAVLKKARLSFEGIMVHEPPDWD